MSRIDLRRLARGRGEAGIAMILTTEMMRNPRVETVERDRIKELIAEQRLSLSGLVDQ